MTMLKSVAEFHNHHFTNNFTKCHDRVSVAGSCCGSCCYRWSFFWSMVWQRHSRRLCAILDVVNVSFCTSATMQCVHTLLKSLVDKKEVVAMCRLSPVAAACTSHRPIQPARHPQPCQPHYAVSRITVRFSMLPAQSPSYRLS